MEKENVYFLFYGEWRVGLERRGRERKETFLYCTSRKYDNQRTDKMSELDITSKQKEVLDELPSTRKEIAEKLNISRRSVRYRMNRIEENTDINFKRESDGVWYINDNDDTERNENPKRTNSYDKAQITKDAHNKLTELEKEVKEALNNTSPVKHSYSRNKSGSTLVLPHSDAHVGSVVKDRYNVDYYGAEEAREAIREHIDKGISHAERREDVEDVVFIMNGDLIDGEGIFASQRHEQEDNVREQLRKAGNTYIEEILKLSEEFEHVSVYCVPGNHGKLGKESTTNFDMMLYDFVETALHYSDAENINIQKSDSAGIVQFVVRGWNYLSRHGQKYLNHVGTSSGQNRVKDDYMAYGFDILLRSHYHKTLIERVGDEIPVVMTGSPSPPSTFAESQGESGGCCGIFWFTTEDKVMEDIEPVRINNGKV